MRGICIAFPTVRATVMARERGCLQAAFWASSIRPRSLPNRHTELLRRRCHEEAERMSYCKGQVLNVARDPQHRFGKQIQENITLIQAYGVDGDAHAGHYAKHRFIARRLTTLRNMRQIHLIPAELFAELRNQGHIVGPGELGENVATLGLKLEHLPLGTRLHLGRTAVVELTGIRTPCRQIDRFKKGLKQEMLRTDATGPKYRCGVLGIIMIGGRVLPGDLARAKISQKPTLPCRHCRT